jgi:hypothetical protein
MQQNIKTIALAALLACGLPAVAATPIQLKFEGLATSSGGVVADVRADNFYAGGSSKDPVTGDPVVVAPLDQNFGTVFIGPAIVTTASDAGGDGSFTQSRTLITSSGTFDSTALGAGAMYADGASGTAASFTIDPTLDFDTGISFFYTGELSIQVTTTDGVLGATFPAVIPSGNQCTIIGNTSCLWAEASFAFAGKAQSVTFSGSAFGFLVDNVTLGALDPLKPVDPGVPPIPEPSTYALMALGLAAVGFAARRRKQRG